MRHDIDFDLGVAGSLAEVEREEGIQATYFFLLRTNHYNVLSKEGTATVRRILSGCHHLALHFDCASYAENASEGELAEACRKEAALLGEWFGSKVEIVSYHRPSPLVLTGNPALSAPLPHTYTSRFMKEMKYCSDSRGEWRHGDPRSSVEFAQREPMHILVHPVWWNSDVCRAEETVARWLNRQIGLLEDSAAANCTVYRKRGLMERGLR
jgi:hypothetical protein